MSDPKIDVPYVAHLARLHLSPEETAKFQKQLGDVLGYIETLQKVDISQVPDASEDPDFENNLRPDAEHPGLTTDAALTNAPQRGNDLFMVPRMVE